MINSFCFVASAHRKLRELQEKLDQLRQLSHAYQLQSEGSSEREARATSTKDGPYSGARTGVPTQDDRSSIAITPDIDEFEAIRARIMA